MSSLDCEFQRYFSQEMLLDYQRHIKPQEIHELIFLHNYCSRAKRTKVRPKPTRHAPESLQLLRVLDPCDFPPGCIAIDFEAGLEYSVE